ncbi:hypothetical protein CSKR_204085 [Clonorchis sinensis]|uniref:Uncharacterized protein n=1 Tax=Clonorchis sinensis TaxID=79923 RepID=A0A8T1M818_CLOSI|nr:hypothetical protein CSKR_204085 [Clonorchis sinensis]
MMLTYFSSMPLRTKQHCCATRSDKSRGPFISKDVQRVRWRQGSPP